MYCGTNTIDGILATVVRRRAKRIIIRIKPGGEVVATIPPWRATLACVGISGLGGAVGRLNEESPTRGNVAGLCGEM